MPPSFDFDDRDTCRYWGEMRFKVDQMSYYGNEISASGGDSQEGDGGQWDFEDQLLTLPDNVALYLKHCLGVRMEPCHKLLGGCPHYVTFLHDRLE